MTSPTAPSGPTPATGFKKSLPQTLEGIVNDCDAQLVRVEERRSALLRDRAWASELLTVAKLANENPEAIRLMDGTAQHEDEPKAA